MCLFFKKCSRSIDNIQLKRVVIIISIESGQHYFHLNAETLREKSLQGRTTHIGALYFILQMWSGMIAISSRSGRDLSLKWSPNDVLVGPRVRWQLAVELLLRDGGQVLHEPLEVLHLAVQPLRRPRRGEGLQLLGAVRHGAS